MNIAMSGASGLIGKALTRRLRAEGHRVTRLVRQAPDNLRDVFFDVDRGWIDRERLEAVDVVVHLAGENVGEGRWTSDKKQRILDSRVRSTTILAEALAELPRPPKAFISASATGIYGERGDALLNEESGHGSGFLAEVCKAWEAACAPAEDAGIRTVRARIGVVLSTEGGALAKMRTPFALGLGGVVGDGRQWMSWISLRDAVDALVHLATGSSLEGPVNLVAPAPATNAELTKALGRALRRPAVMPLPAFAAKLALGDERATELLLTSTRVAPARLFRDGFTFADPSLSQALQSALSPRRAA